MTKEEIEKEAEKANGYTYFNPKSEKAEAFNEGFMAGANFTQSQSNEQRYKEALERINQKLEEIRIEVAKTFAELSSERIDRMIYDLSMEIFKVLE